jgi:hypothetical protein
MANSAVRLSKLETALADGAGHVDRQLHTFCVSTPEMPIHMYGAGRLEL